jgi:hypothetical protein
MPLTRADRGRDLARLRRISIAKEEVSELAKRFDRLMLEPDRLKDRLCSGYSACLSGSKTRPGPRVS